MSQPSFYTQLEYANQQGEDVSATIQLFEKYKLHIGARTDSAGAAALGIKCQTVSNWRTRGSQAEPRLIEAMATTLEADVGEWLLRAQIEQSFDASNREVWRRMSRRLGYRLGSIGAVLIPTAAQLGGQLRMLVADSAALAENLAPLT
jgi:hypothetical protein